MSPTLFIALLAFYSAVSQLSIHPAPLNQPFSQCTCHCSLACWAFKPGVLIFDPTLPSILHRNINSTTRGNPLKLCTYHPKYDSCKYNFMVRVISLWNSLPTHVITAVSVDSFKNTLDKFWANEEARFDYKANLSGSGFARCF